MLLQVFVFLFGFVSLTFLITSKFSSSNKDFTSNQKLTDMTTSSEINFSLDAQSFVVLESRSNGYEEVKSKNLLPWDLIVEPNRANTVRIAKFVSNHMDVDVHTEDFKVVWSIGQEEYYGPSFQLELSTVGTVKGGVKIFRKVAQDAASSSDMELLYSQDITVAVKYVRREIRSLTEADRSKFFKALRIMYTTSQEDGSQRYGSSFLSAETILLTHLTSAGMYGRLRSLGVSSCIHVCIYVLVCRHDGLRSLARWRWVLDAPRRAHSAGGAKPAGRRPIPGHALLGLRPGRRPVHRGDHRAVGGLPAGLVRGGQPLQQRPPHRRRRLLERDILPRRRQVLVRLGHSGHGVAEPARERLRPHAQSLEQQPVALHRPQELHLRREEDRAAVLQRLQEMLPQVHSQGGNLPTNTTIITTTTTTATTTTTIISTTTTITTTITTTTTNYY